MLSYSGNHFCIRSEICTSSIIIEWVSLSSFSTIQHLSIYYEWVCASAPTVGGSQSVHGRNVVFNEFARSWIKIHFILSHAFWLLFFHFFHTRVVWCVSVLRLFRCLHLDCRFFSFFFLGTFQQDAKSRYTTKRDGNHTKWFRLAFPVGCHE